MFVCENVLLFGSVFLRVCENNINQRPSSLYGLIDKIDQHQPRTKEYKHTCVFSKYKTLELDNSHGRCQSSKDKADMWILD